MDIRSVMTPNPACCSPDTSLQDVAQMMMNNDCGQIPVVDQNRQPLGGDHRPGHRGTCRRSGDGSLERHRRRSDDAYMRKGIGAVRILGFRLGFLALGKPA
jgi:CBS domain-containing protein